MRHLPLIDNRLLQCETERFPSSFHFANAFFCFGFTRLPFCSDSRQHASLSQQNLLHHEQHRHQHLTKWFRRPLNSNEISLRFPRFVGDTPHRKSKIKWQFPFPLFLRHQQNDHRYASREFFLSVVTHILFEKGVRGQEGPWCVQKLTFCMILLIRP